MAQPTASAVLEQGLPAASATAAPSAREPAGERSEPRLLEFPTCEQPCPACQPLVQGRRSRQPPTALEQSAYEKALAEYLAQSRCEGRVPAKADLDVQLFDVARGSFTEPGAKESVVLVFFGDCGQLASHAANYGEHFLVLVAEDGQHDVFPPRSAPTHVKAVTDLEGDGVEELVLGSGFTGAGGHELYSTIHSLKGGEPAESELHLVEESGCSFQAPKYLQREVFRGVDAAAGGACLLLREKLKPCPP